MLYFNLDLHIAGITFLLNEEINQWASTKECLQWHHPAIQPNRLGSIYGKNELTFQETRDMLDTAIFRSSNFIPWRFNIYLWEQSTWDRFPGSQVGWGEEGIMYG